MKKILTLLAFLTLTFQLYAQVSYINGDLSNINFGNTVTVLQNGNYVVTDPNWKNENNLQNVGAVYLYNGATHQLISKLTGSHANDRIGSNGVKVFSNGNFIIRSPFWNNTYGAVTFVNGVTGLNGIINESNSLVGNLESDRIGNGDITTLPNGHLLLKDFSWRNFSGYVTWINSDNGAQGLHSLNNNTIKGSATGSYVGQQVNVLSNSNYVVTSPLYGGSISPLGRISFCSGSTGTEINNLTGTNNGSFASSSIKELPNQKFVLISPNWQSGKGAITVVNSDYGFTGAISSSNSLVGQTAEDMVGSGNITLLKNGNLVIQSPNWGGSNEYGAVTWINKNTGITGVLSEENSLVGKIWYENAGSGNIIELPNGNFLIQNPAWDNNAGAVIWVNGNTGIKGYVENQRTLSGDVSQRIGSKVVVLSNSNYIVFSPSWYESFMSPSVGAVTWCNGTSGTQGFITRYNSLIGSQYRDIFLSGNAVELSNGNYVIINSGWGGGKGAVTWASGIQPTTGEISSANSLIGTLDSDNIGAYGITALKNGNYLINSADWNNNAGAVTWANGTLPLTGEINISNSLIGNNPNDKVGNKGIVTFPNGLYAIKSSDWNNQGAITWANGNTTLTGHINATNSLLGANLNEKITDSKIKLHANGNLVLANPNWNNNKGAITWVNSNTGKTGFLNSSNALVGSNDNDLLGLEGIDSLLSGNFVVRSASWDNKKGAVTWIGSNTELTGTINSSNSLTGTINNDQIGNNPVISLSDSSYVINSPYFNQSRGAITWVKDKKALNGEITACNSLLGNIVNTGNQLVPNFNSSYNYLLTSTGNSTNNFYGIQFLTGDTTSQYFVLTVNIQNNQEEFSNSCETIASLLPSGTNAVSGTVSAKMWNNSPDIPENMVNRHFELTPANNPNTSTGTITLYYSQDDFDTYNRDNSPKLPTSPSDDFNTEYFVIEKRSGISNDNSGLPHSYPGAAVNIVLHPDSVKWVADKQKWAISFDVKGFSGFFLKSATIALPVKWLNVYAKKQSSQTAVISWKVQESDVDNYVIEKSVDGIYFTSIGNLKSVGNGTNQYTAYDNQFTAVKSYYRILQVDKNGKNSYSSIVNLNQDNNTLVSIYPNPANNYIVINTPEDFIGQTGVITDVNGRSIQSFKIAGTAQTINLNNIQKGLYLIRFNNGNIIKFIKH